MRVLLAAVVVAMSASSPAFAQHCSDAEKVKLQELDKAWSESQGTIIP